MNSLRRFKDGLVGCFVLAALHIAVTAQPRLVIDQPDQYRVGDRVDPETVVLNRGMEPIPLLDLIRPETWVAVISIFGGGVLQRPDPPFRGNLWCEDSFDDLAIQRALVRTFESQPVQFIALAVPPVYNPTRYGFAKDAFLGLPEDSEEYLSAVRGFIEATERERLSGLLPFEEVFYDPKFRLAENRKERMPAPEFGEVYPWQGKLRWAQDLRRYGTPILWLIDPEGRLLRPPLFGNDYDADPPQVFYGFAEAREAIEECLALKAGTN